MDEVIKANAAMHFTAGDYVVATLIAIAFLAVLVAGFMWFLLRFYGGECDEAGKRAQHPSVGTDDRQGIHPRKVG
jgi:hypothetical protein